MNRTCPAYTTGPSNLLRHPSQLELPDSDSSDLSHECELECEEGLEEDKPAGKLEKGLLRIGDLARLTHKTVRTLHFYEELDILRPLERTKGGFRLYRNESIARIWLIDKLQVLGLSLPEVKELLIGWEGSETGSIAARKIKTVLAVKKKELNNEISRLQNLARELDAAMGYLELCTTGCGKSTSPCQCRTCEHAVDDATRPRVISGLYPQ